MSESDEITIKDFPEELMANRAELADKNETPELTEESIGEALLAHNKHKSAAARALDIIRKTLWSTINDFDIR